MKNFFIVLITLAFMASTVPAFAEVKGEMKKVPKPKGPIDFVPGAGYPKGQYGIIFKYITFEKDDLYDGSSKEDFVSKQKPKPYEQTMHKYIATFRVGLFESVDARLIVPFLDKEMKRKSLTQDVTDDNSGIGDIKLIGRYQVLSQKKGNPIFLALGLGVKMPTGDTDEKDQGKYLPSFLQTGTGSWDPIFEIAGTKMFGRSRIDGVITYNLTTEGEWGTSDFERGNHFKYDLGYGFAISRHFDLELELNGNYRQKNKVDDIKKETSGGHIIYITPGIHIKFMKKSHFALGVPIVVYRDLNGPRLSEDYRIVGKLAFVF